MCGIVEIVKLSGSSATDVEHFDSPSDYFDKLVNQLKLGSDFAYKVISRVMVDGQYEWTASDGRVTYVINKDKK